MQSTQVDKLKSLGYTVVSLKQAGNLDRELEKILVPNLGLSEASVFETRFYYPCLEFLMKIGRYVDAYTSRESSTSFDHLVQNPLAISKICKAILSTNMAKNVEIEY